MTSPSPPTPVRDDAVRRRLRVTVWGAVQGVGFRPFVYRLARDLELDGWVLNSAQGVFLEVEGTRAALETFRDRLAAKPPPRARILGSEHWILDPAGYRGFEIRQSDDAGATSVLVLPDIATCDDCRREILDPGDRRFRYPFTNCTNCGPRFSIIRRLPYDRASTTMAGFTFCARCRAEYEDPADRRFHAQPNACPDCGPRLELRAAGGVHRAAGDAALLQAEDALRHGEVVAVHGLGGFHLMVDARDEAAVRRLRERKRREEKPLALMMASLEAAARSCEIDPLEEELLTAPEAPIVLLRRRDAADELAPAIAPANPYLGVMLPATPLHHLLLGDLGFPLVATSGNLSDEPICTDPAEAAERLAGIADLLLVHDRPIARHVDDSIVRVVAGRAQVLRRARGFAPLPIPLGTLRAKAPILALGPHLKNTVALAVGDQAFLSQHVGDLDTGPARAAHRRVAADLQQLFDAPAATVACDAHPDYASTREAEARGLPLVRVQHHLAHVLACIAENEITGPVLGVSWDGTGYGLDGTVWGGEFLHVEGAAWERRAHLRTFRLPGGETAIREPRRAALGVLWELFGEAALEMEELAPIRDFAPGERALLAAALQRGLNSPRTSSAGRLFDAVASLGDLRQKVRFEGQAAMELEFSITDPESGGAPYPMELRRPAAGALVLDWEPLIRCVLADLRRGSEVGAIARSFHDGLVAGIVAVARAIGEEKVALSGGCFQNRYLLERSVRSLAEAGFHPYWHQRVPPNDGGIAVGQIIAALTAPKPGSPEAPGSSRSIP